MAIPPGPLLNLQNARGKKGYEEKAQKQKQEKLE